MKKLIMTVPFLFFAMYSKGQTPPQSDPRIYDIVDSVSADRIEQDIRTLANFGTRNTFSDTVSETRGIGAARRWIKAEFEKISTACKNCLEVSYNMVGCHAGAPSA